MGPQERPQVAFPRVPQACLAASVLAKRECPLADLPPNAGLVDSPFPPQRREDLMADWFRMHLGGDVAANAIWAQDRCDASVIEPEGQHRVPTRVACDCEDIAKRRAEELLLEAYPHDCQGSGCGAWQRYGGPAGGEVH